MIPPPDFLFRLHTSGCTLSSYCTAVRDDTKDSPGLKQTQRLRMKHRWLFVLQLLAPLGPACCATLLHLRVEAGSEDISSGHSQLNGRRSLAWSDFIHPAAHSAWPLPWIDEGSTLSMSRAMDILRENGMVF